MRLRRAGLLRIWLLGPVRPDRAVRLMRWGAGFLGVLLLAACGGPGATDADAGGGGALGSGGAQEPPGGTGGASSGGHVASGGALLGTGGAVSGGATGGSETGGQPGGGGEGTGGGGGSGGDPGVPNAEWPQINGVQWADTAGDPIQAHGGGVLQVGDDYYWFGENRNPDGTFFAVSAYRSRDLKQWEFRNHVLTMDSAAGLDPANVERPKVVYNEATGKYVMWMHWENGMDYGEARAAVASSDTVDGDYTYHGSFRPYQDEGVTDHGKPGYMSRDCTLFVDDDGKGYFLSATNENYDLNLYELTPDYLEVDHLVETLFPGGHREAPALFKRGDVYFLITSGSTGWDPNQAQYATSTGLASGWSSMRNVADGNTFYSQSTYVVEVAAGGDSQFLYLGDRWAGAYGGPVNDSTYVWQPISFSSDTQMSMSWNNTLHLDARAGRVQASTERFHFVSALGELRLDVQGESTADGADLVLAAPNDGESQTWSFNYNGNGGFRLTNQNSQKVVDVTDESTAEGAVIGQWSDNGGDHQAFVLVDLGQGRYRLRNRKSGKFVTAATETAEVGAAIEQRSLTDAESQVWRIVIAEGTAE